MYSIDIKGQHLDFEEDSLSINNYLVSYKDLQNINIDNTKFEFDYNGKHIAMPINQDIADNIKPILFKEKPATKIPQNTKNKQCQNRLKDKYDKHILCALKTLFFIGLYILYYDKSESVSLYLIETLVFTVIVHALFFKTKETTYMKCDGISYLIQAIIASVYISIVEKEFFASTVSETNNTFLAFLVIVLSVIAFSILLFIEMLIIDIIMSAIIKRFQFKEGPKSYGLLFLLLKAFSIIAIVFIDYKLFFSKAETGAALISLVKIFIVLGLIAMIPISIIMRKFFNELSRPQCVLMDVVAYILSVIFNVKFFNNVADLGKFSWSLIVILGTLAFLLVTISIDLLIKKKESHEINMG